MRRFRFSLETTLKYRETIEAMRRQAAAAVQTELAECGRRIDSCLVELRRTVSQVWDPSDVALIRQKELYTDQLSGRLKHLQGERLRILERLASAQAALVTASQNRKAIQKVREKRYAEYLCAVAAEEQALLDEIGGRPGSGR